METYKNELPEKFNISNRQYGRLHTVLRDPFFSINFSGKTGKWIAESTRPATAAEMDALAAAIRALPDDPLPGEELDQDHAQHPFFNMTPDQAEAFIQNGVNDAAGTKQALKLMARLLVHLNRKIKR